MTASFEVFDEDGTMRRHAVATLFVGGGALSLVGACGAPAVSDRVDFVPDADLTCPRCASRVRRRGGRCHRKSAENCHRAVAPARRK